MAAILFCAPNVALTNRKAPLHSFLLIFFKAEHGTVNRQSYLILDTSPPSLVFEPCRGLTKEVATHFFSSKYRSCSNQPITWLHNCVTTFAVTSSCRDITCKSIPGSSPPFLSFIGTRLRFSLLWACGLSVTSRDLQ